MATEKVTYELSLRDLMTKGLSDINAKLGTMENKLAETEKKAKQAASGMSGAFKGLGSVLSTLAIGAFIKDSVFATAKMQSLGNAIKFASDSSTQGELSLNWLSNFSNKWGVSLDAAQEGFRTFQGAMIKTTFTSNEVRKMFEQVSMGGIAMGLSAEDTKGTFLALGQIMGKGKVQAEELRGQIGERVPGAFAIAARAMGVTTMALDKMMKNGELMANDFLPKFAAEMEKTFSVGAIDNVDSMSSNINRLSSAWLELQVSMGESQGGLINNAISGWAIGLNYIADQFRTIDQLAGRSSNQGAIDLLAYMENDMRSKKLGMQKSGKSKSEIETALNYQASSAKNAWQLQIEEKEKKKADLEGLISGDPKLVTYLNRKLSGTGEYSSKEDLFKNNDQYRKTLEELNVLKKGSSGLQGIADKEISNMYDKGNSEAEAAKLKEQSASVSGGVPKVVNINIEALIKDVKNYFSSGNAAISESKNFLDQLQQALNTIVTDVGIVAQYGR